MSASAGTVPPTDQESRNAVIGLFFILLVAISNQWQHFILAYAYSLCKPDYKDDPFTNICADYPAFDRNYGLLSGAAFLISFACFGIIFGGSLADSMSRKNIINASVILWSATTVATGAIKSFSLLYVMRFLLGLFQSFLNPAAYSIISDLFRRKHRTTANAVFGLGTYFGVGVASFSGILMVQLGWRFTFQIVGYIGIALGIVGQFVLVEPERNRFDKRKNLKVTTDDDDN